MRSFLSCLVATLTLAGSLNAAAPQIARFQSNLGNFEVLLWNEDLPVTCDNFIRYANSDAYVGTFLHRSFTNNTLDIQIIQGGTYTIDLNEPVVEGPTTIPTFPPIALNAIFPNQRGTIAMARTNDRDSATSGWYFNLDNNVGLDFNYSVFGNVMGTGQNVIDAMGEVPTFNFGGAFTTFPLQNFIASPVLVTNFIFFQNISVEAFAITSITSSLEGVEIAWTPLSTNTPVRVERTTEVGGDPWTTLATGIVTGSYLDTAPPPGQAFYRVVAE